MKIEIKAGQGGENTKGIIRQMAKIYSKITKAEFNWLVNSCEAIIDPKFEEFFRNEVGIHVWQDYDRGKVQTCTFTVSVVEEVKQQIDLDNVDKKYTRGSGNGGQNRNKVETCVVLTDKTTGLSVRYQGQRFRGQNEKQAYKLLEEKLEKVAKENSSLDENNQRLQQIKTDKGRKRTYKIKDGIVIDHITGKRMSVKDLFKGNLYMLK